MSVIAKPFIQQLRFIFHCQQFFFFLPKIFFNPFTFFFFYSYSKRYGYNRGNDVVPSEPFIVRSRKFCFSNCFLLHFTVYHRRPRHLFWICRRPLKIITNINWYNPTRVILKIHSRCSFFNTFMFFIKAIIFKEFIVFFRISCNGYKTRIVNLFNIKITEAFF